MSNVIQLVVGDDRPVITLTFTDDITGLGYDVSDADVSVRFRAAGRDTVTLGVITCTAVEGQANKAQFDFTSGILDGIDPGMYEGEVVIDEGEFRQTVYHLLKFRVRANFGEVPE
jgi:hypothetical protein